MAQPQVLNQRVVNEQAQIFYNKEGKPVYALIPLKPLKKRTVSEILEESASEAKRQGIKLKDLLLELEKVRKKLYEKYYA